MHTSIQGLSDDSALRATCALRAAGLARFSALRHAEFGTVCMYTHQRTYPRQRENVDFYRSPLESSTPYFARCMVNT